MKELGNLRKKFSDQLVAIRKERGWTQHDLAAETGWSIGKVRNLEQCINSPSLEELEAIGRIIHREPTFFEQQAPSENEKYLNQILQSLPGMDSMGLKAVALLLGSPELMESIRIIPTLDDAQARRLIKNIYDLALTCRDRAMKDSVSGVKKLG